MLLLSLILIQLFGILIFFVFFTGRNKINRNTIKIKALIITTLALLVSLITWFLCDNSCKYLQFVQKHYTIGHYDFYLGLVNLLIYFVLLIALTVLFFFFLSSKSNTNNTSIKQSSFPLVEFILCSFLVSLITGLFDNLYMWVTSDYIPCNWEKWFAFNEETRNKVLIALSSGDLELLRSTYKILFATLQQNCIFLKNTEIIFYNQPFGMKEINNLSYFEVYVEDFSKLLVNLEVEIKKLS